VSWSGASSSGRSPHAARSRGHPTSRYGRECYGKERAASALKSYLPAHNQVAHTPGTSHGERGFRRFWIPPEWAGRGWSKCPCGWSARSWGDAPHYAWTEHVKHWRGLIKKHGSLEAAQKAESRKIWRHVSPAMRQAIANMVKEEKRRHREIKRRQAAKPKRVHK
jgi:hypothetical protein